MVERDYLFMVTTSTVYDYSSSYFTSKYGHVFLSVVKLFKIVTLFKLHF